MLERAEAVLESIHEELCDGLARCDREALDELGATLISVRGLTDGPGGSDLDATLSAVSALLACVQRCSSVLMQSVAVMSSNVSDADVRVAALRALWGLSEAHQERVSAEEVAAFAAVKQALVSKSDEICI